MSIRFPFKLFVVVVVVSALAISVILPNLCRERSGPQRARCAANLKSIGTALQKYANDNGDCYPDSIDAIVKPPVQFPPEVLVCPSSNEIRAANVETINEGGHISYVYLGKGRKCAEMGMDDPLVYEPLSNHKGAGANALFGDTHVEFLTPAELAKVLARPTTLPATGPSTPPAK